MSLAHRRQDVVGRKRSVAIDGHHTSISLEEAFWNELIALSRERGMAINALVAELDLGRGLDGANLSSAVRIFILLELKKQHALQRGIAGGFKVPALFPKDGEKAGKRLKIRT